MICNLFMQLGGGSGWNFNFAIAVFLIGKLVFDLVMVISNSGRRNSHYLVQTMREELLRKCGEETSELRFFANERQGECSKLKFVASCVNEVGNATQEDVVLMLLRNSYCQPEVEETRGGENVNVHCRFEGNACESERNGKCTIMPSNRKSIILSTSENSRSGSAFMMEMLQKNIIQNYAASSKDTILLFWLAETAQLQDIYQRHISNVSIHLHFHSLAIGNCIPVIGYTQHAESRRRAQRMKRLFWEESVSVRMKLIDFSFPLIHFHCEKPSVEVHYSSLNALQVMSLVLCLMLNEVE